MCCALPLQERCSSLSTANTNLGKTVEALNELVNYFNVTKGVEPRLLAGPRGDYDSYFAMVDRLQASEQTFRASRCRARKAARVIRPRTPRVPPLSGIASRNIA